MLKTNILLGLLLLIGLTFMTSCDGDNVDDIEIIDDEINAQMICDSFDFRLEYDTTVLRSRIYGGTPEFSYLWSTGSTEYSITVNETDTYSLTITDSEGCTASHSYDYDACVAFQGGIYIPDSIQSGHILKIHHYAGIAPYTYMWSTGENTTQIEVSESANYSVTVTDAEGCTLIESFDYWATGDCAFFSANITAERDPNFPGTYYLSSNAQGGTPPYAFQWSTNEGSADITVTQSGTYEVTVIDANGCTEVSSFDLEIGPGDCNSFRADITATRDSTTGTTLILLANPGGGTEPYTYEWSNGRQRHDIVVSESGVYSVTITDAIGCELIVSKEVDIDSQDCDGFVTRILSEEDSNSATTFHLTALPDGGTVPYTYFWSTNETSEKITVTSPGFYSVTVTDADGCTETGGVQL